MFQAGDYVCDTARCLDSYEEQVKKDYYSLPGGSSGMRLFIATQANPSLPEFCPEVIAVWTLPERQGLYHSI